MRQSTRTAPSTQRQCSSVCAGQSTLSAEWRTGGRLVEGEVEARWRDEGMQKAPNQRIRGLEPDALRAGHVPLERRSSHLFSRLRMNPDDDLAALGAEPPLGEGSESAVALGLPAPRVLAQ